MVSHSRFHRYLTVVKNDRDRACHPDGDNCASVVAFPRSLTNDTRDDDLLLLLVLVLTDRGRSRAPALSVRTEKGGEAAP